MTFGTDSAGLPVAPTPVRIVEGATATNEVGQTVATLPIRYVDSDSATDETGSPTEAMQIEVVEDASALPVRVVEGATTTNEVGQAVAIVPVWTGEDATPDWVPEGALADLDFANGRYYRADLGLCDLADIFTEDAVNWGAFDPETMIVTDAGLTTGTVSSVANSEVRPLFTAGVWALVSAVDGATIISHKTIVKQGVLGNTDQIHFGYQVQDFPDYNYSLGNDIGTKLVPLGGDFLACDLYHGPDEIFLQDVINIGSFEGVYGVTLDFSGEVTTSLGGVTGPTASYAADYSAMNSLGLSMGVFNVSGTAILCATVSRIVVYPPVANQAALNALTA